jgi:hypothetical protein
VCSGGSRNIENRQCAEVSSKGYNSEPDQVGFGSSNRPRNRSRLKRIILEELLSVVE